MNITVENIAEYQGHTGSLYALTVDEAGNRAFSSGDDGIVAGWELSKLKDDGVGVLRVEKAVYALFWIEEWKWLAVGMSDGTVHIIDPDSKTIIKTIRKITESVYGLHYEEERGYLWVLYGKGYVSVLKLPDFEEIGFRQLADNNLRAILFSHLDSSIFFGTSDHNILRMEKNSGELDQSWKAHENSVFALALHPDGRYLLSGGRDAHLNVWEATSPYSSLEKIPAHNFTVNAIVFSPDGRYFMTASRDKTLKLWDAETIRLLKVIDMFRNKGHKHSVNRLAWLPDGTILSAGDDRRLIRWKLTVHAEN